MKKTYINILLLLFPIILKAHQDQYFVSEFDNVVVRIKTARKCEEVIKSEFIGEYCSILADQLNYNNKIFIDLIHDYGNSMEARNFISFNNGEYKVVWGDEMSKVKLGRKRKYKNRIIIRQIQFSFDISQLLKQLEYAILNLSYIKSNSNLINHSGYSENMKYIFESIPDNEVLKIAKANSSPIICKVLEHKIYRPGSEEYYQLSYFTQNGKYYIYDNSPDKIEVIDSINNIYFFDRNNGILSSVLFLFVNPKEFYCIYDNFSEKVSYMTKKHTIETINNYYYQNIEINKLSEGVFTISHYRFGLDNIALFYIENEKLISDFNSVLKKLKE